MLDDDEDAGGKWYDDPDEDLCPDCSGDGEENTCWDDMCSGQDECIHGDGMILCRTCGGSGYI